MPARRGRPYQEIRVTSWDQFLKLITSSPYLSWAFRGQADHRLPLYTALSRYFLDRGIRRHFWAAQEERILRIFKRKAHQYVDQPPALDDSFQWLALMQHHGAPTRLLDFTWSPYVAAFFALARSLADGCVWALNPSRVISPEVKKMDPRIAGNFESYFLQGERPLIWLGEPHTMNRRLIAQSGTFVVPGVLDKPLDQILRESQASGDMMAKFVLSRRIRDSTMRELYRMNITYATLFPDLDGLARSLGYELEFHWAYNPKARKRPHVSSRQSPPLVHC